jgi:predicted ArsR family transcriptional regulator
MTNNFNRCDKTQYNKRRVLRAVRGLDYGYGVMAVEVADAVGLPRRTTNRHLTKLYLDGEVVRKGWFWHSKE